MYKGLKPQPCSCSATPFIPCSGLIFRGQVPQSLYLSSFYCYLFRASLGRSESCSYSTILYRRDDLKITHFFLILALTSSVSAAPIRQFLLGPVVREELC